jgi:cbb3-type cytochrome c oxidase subunit III
VTFQGDVATTGIASAAAPRIETTALAPNVGPPEGTNPNAGAAAPAVASLPVPPGATAAQVALGAQVFHGQAGGGTCEGCHGSNAQGTPLAPGLTSGKWLWGDGSLASITHTINDGVPSPKDYRSPMPPKGGAQLSNADVSAVAAYVWALGHQEQASR